MKKFWKRALKWIATMGLVGLGVNQALIHNGVDPVTANAISGQVEQQVDRAADKYGTEE